jgi:hypothetical protein
MLEEAATAAMGAALVNTPADQAGVAAEADGPAEGEEEEVREEDAVCADGEDSRDVD